MLPQVTEMLMQAIQAQVAEALEDEVQVVDMVPAPAQQQQRGRWAPTATVMRAQAKQQQQQQQTVSRSQLSAATPQEPQALVSQPQTDREWKLSVLLAKYKMALDTAHEDLRTAASSAVTVVSLNEELTAKVVNLENKLKKVQEERQNAITKLQEKLEEIKTLWSTTTDEESIQLQEENIILKSTVDTLQENIEQYCQEISNLEEQVSQMQESGV